ALLGVGGLLVSRLGVGGLLVRRLLVRGLLVRGLLGLVGRLLLVAGLLRLVGLVALVGVLRVLAGVGPGLALVAAGGDLVALVEVVLRPGRGLDRVLLGHVLAELGHRVPADHLGPAAAHRLQRLGEHHLEVGELVVDVVVGVLADPARLLQGGAADALGLAPHLGARQHAAALAPGRLDVLRGVPPGLGYHLIALGDQAPRFGELLGHSRGEL